MLEMLNKEKLTYALLKTSLPYNLQSKAGRLY